MIKFQEIYHFFKIVVFFQYFVYDTRDFKLPESKGIVNYIKTRKDLSDWKIQNMYR